MMNNNNKLRESIKYLCLSLASFIISLILVLVIAKYDTATCILLIGFLVTFAIALIMSIIDTIEVAKKIKAEKSCKYRPSIKYNDAEIEDYYYNRW